MKIFKTTLIVIIGIVLMLDAFLLPFQFLAFDEGYYYKLFSELKVHEQIGIDDAALNRITQALVSYIDNGSGDITLKESVNGNEVQFYNDKEIQHLHDIQVLVKAARSFLVWMNILMLLCIILLWWNGRDNATHLIKDLFRPFKYAFFMTIVALCGLISLYFIDFDWAFRKFHEIFFTNDLWLLDPKTDRLIMLMPLEFFITFVSKWLTSVSIILAVYFTAGYFAPRNLLNR
ncbi:TIGR01906 family membrane protein [Fusibacter bizertensis]|uniref:TIGR01906 family membrane protein n=1 Tax=Fusibacter bizertensis TaxID=1488331 RepID=A0ABT6NBE9_9FIRM|nr:TIGR01906 family membrane protein [Fusibacter bizertensis]MDH8677710.1 TIGR01906 family membrane protein [Fusibacter bizertensis]